MGRNDHQGLDPDTQPTAPTTTGTDACRSLIEMEKAQTNTRTKEKCNDDADNAANDAMSDNSIMRDLAGEAPAYMDGLCYMLTLAEDNADTILGNDNVTMGAPPSLWSESAKQHLKPPPRAKPSSSTLSCMNKHRRERSPKRM